MRLLSILLLIGVLLAGRAEAALYSQTVNQLIPDGNANGYFTTINVESAETIHSLTVSFDVTGGNTGDLYAYLTRDGGGFAVLLNRVGKTSSTPFGYCDSAFTVTLSDAAATDIHAYSSGGPAVVGSYQPDGRNVDPLVVLDTDSRGAMLSSFNNYSAAGVWTLFFADMAGGNQQSTLESWSLEINAVPEPVNVALGVFAGFVGLWQLPRAFRRLKQRGAARFHAKS